MKQPFFSLRPPFPQPRAPPHHSLNQANDRRSSPTGAHCPSPVHTFTRIIDVSRMPCSLVLLPRLPLQLVMTCASSVARRTILSTSSTRWSSRKCSPHRQSAAVLPLSRPFSSKSRRTRCRMRTSSPTLPTKNRSLHLHPSSEFLPTSSPRTLFAAGRPLSPHRVCRSPKRLDIVIQHHLACRWRPPRRRLPGAHQAAHPNCLCPCPICRL
mmetsp:Transcript_17026/g.51502  ORF Transcript_17026/g.51502 Transcript_17026/m.51502 type:complete len:211 (+) Transcript_17026:784-1416(+)